MDFNCKQCGLCCSHIGQGINVAKMAVIDGTADKLTNELAAFPYKYNEAGRCENLGDDNLCKIYDTRPDICRVNKLYEKHFSDKMQRKEFYELNEQMCDQLIENSKVNA